MQTYSRSLQIKVLGSIVYAYIQIKGEKSWVIKEKKTYFLFVSDKTKTYKMYNINPITKKMLASRDAIFDEENFWPQQSNSDAIHVIPTDLGGEKDATTTQPQQAVVSTPTEKSAHKSHQHNFYSKQQCSATRKSTWQHMIQKATKMDVRLLRCNCLVMMIQMIS